MKSNASVSRFGFKSVSKLGPTITLLLATALVGCGGFEGEGYGAPGSPADGTSSLSDEREPASPTDPGKPEAPESMLPAEPGPTEDRPLPATPSASLELGAPAAGSLAIGLQKGGEESPRDLIKGNLPGTGPSSVVVVPRPAPEEPPVCEKQCEGGTVLDPASCQCQCPDAQAVSDCRYQNGHWDDQTCACVPSPR